MQQSIQTDRRTIAVLCIRPTQIQWQRQVFTRESSYCFQRVLAIAILSVRLSVRLSHGWISQKRCKLESPNLHRRLLGGL